MGLSITYAFWTTTRDANIAAKEANFQRLSDRTFDDALQRLQRPMYGLGGLRGSLATLQRASPEFDDLSRYTSARDLPGEFPGVYGFGTIARVERSRITEFQADMQSQLGSAFQVRTSWLKDPMYVIKSIEPIERNASAIGVDIGSQAQGRNAVERVFREGRPIVTAPMTLAQDPQKRVAALIIAPVFSAGGASKRTPNDRVDAVIFAAFTYAELMGGGFAEEESGIRLLVKDLGDGAPRVVYDSAPFQSALSRHTKVVRKFEHFGRPFELSVTPTSDSLAVKSDAVGVAFAGILASLFAAFATMQVGRTHDRARVIAASMTRELTRLAAVARLTHSAVVVTDPNGRIQWSNPAFQRLTGYDESELLGEKPGDLLQTSETDPEEIKRIRTSLNQHQRYSGVLLNRSKSARDYLVELEIQPMFTDDGELSGFISVETDVTERLNQSAALKASEAFLDRTSELCRVGGWRIDFNTGVVHWSRMTRAIHEVEDDYIPTLATGISFYTPEARLEIAKAIERSTSNGSEFDLELPLVTARGRRIWVRAVGKPEFDNGRVVAIDGALADISEAVAARSRTERERQRLEMILAGTRAGTWEWNLQSGEMRLNERWANIIGYTIDELTPVSMRTWRENAHEEELEESDKKLKAHLRAEVDHYAFEARARHRLGHWIWVLDRGRVMTWTDEGEPEWIFGTRVDITARKEAELRLRQNEALLSTTLHSIGDAVITADADCRLTWINPVAEALTGWTLHDAKGRLSTEVIRIESENEPSLLPCPIATCIEERRKVVSASTTIMLSRDGRRRHVEDSTVPMSDADGTVIGAVMVFHDITEKALLAQEMKFRATHDALTGLLNRTEFEQRVHQALGSAEAGSSSGVLMFLDLDHFKMVNDACGHAAGDRLLAKVATFMRNEVRGNDVTARFGGDEFAILLENCPVDQGEKIAQKIVDAIDAYRFLADDGRRFRVGVSVGLVPVDSRWCSLSEVLQAADEACYAAKFQGRNRVVVFDKSLSHLSANTPVKWGPIIEEALDGTGFELFAQKIVPLTPAFPPPLRFEVLLRLRTADGKMHGPGTFIPAAERYQLASRIDRWVLRAVLEKLKGKRIPHLTRVAINLSGQSIGDREFHRFALNLIDGSGVPPSLLSLEITETAAVHNLQHAADFINELRALDVVVALDDFGAGSASFGYLRALKVDKLKIDGQFIRGLGEGDIEAVAVQSFVEIAKVLGIRTVAEQVESAEIVERLTEMGIDFGQGYFFHRPEAIDTLLDGWMKAHENSFILSPSASAAG